VDGDHTLYLEKDNGKVSVLGDLYVSNGAWVNISHGGQLSNRSNVILSNSRILLGIDEAVEHISSSIKESFNSLVVEGDGVLDFHFHVNDSIFNGFSSIVLNDFWVKEGGLLKLENWDFGRGSQLLVRKDSAHLQESLNRIKFEEYPGYRAGLKEYDRNYWQIISPFPETSTYGAIFGAVGIGLVAWRRRRQNFAN